MKKLLSITGMLLISAICFAQEVVAKDTDPGWLKWLDKLIFIPITLLALSIYSFYRAYIGSKSGSLQNKGMGGSEDSNINVPFLQVHAFKFGVGLLIAAAAAAFGIWWEK